MSSKPILFNTEMVKAILEGRKTQTRRIITTNFMNIEIEKDVMPQKIEFVGFKKYCPSLNFKDNGNAVFRLINNDTKPFPFCDGVEREVDIKPKYKVGDILWVREPAKVMSPPIETFRRMSFKYLADDLHVDIFLDKDFDISKKWIQRCQGVPNGCIKEMARIFLKVTKVRIERLQDMKNNDYLLEGVDKNLTYRYLEKKYPQYMGKYSIDKIRFIELWNSTSKDGYKWEDNPYVFVYEFERII